MFQRRRWRFSDNWGLWQVRELWRSYILGKMFLLWNTSITLPLKIFSVSWNPPGEYMDLEIISVSVCNSSASGDYTTPTKGHFSLNHRIFLTMKGNAARAYLPEKSYLCQVNGWDNAGGNQQERGGKDRETCAGVK